MPRCEEAPGSKSGSRVWCDEEESGECEQLCYIEGEELEWSMLALPLRLSGGRKQCECHPGYSLAADGHKCDDIDECQVEDGIQN